VYLQYWIADPSATLGAAASNGVGGTVVAPPESGGFPAHPGGWIHGGPNCGTEPPIQVHSYNADLTILRQSLCTNFEGPFLFLLFGENRALLMDTGAGGIQIGTAVTNLVNAWATAHGKVNYPLTVCHLHSHGDHVAGDSQFTGKPNVTVVGTSLTAVQNFFGFTGWPNQVATYDLGSRVLDLIPIPGHHATHFAIYDRRTGLLFTGDSLYPGRLYINNAAGGGWTQYKASNQRMVDFVRERPIAWILGTHVEMSTTPGVDFPLGSTSHPNEHVLQLGRRHLYELNDAIHALPGPQQQVHDDFIIFPL
jgi:glyoxylase-like metal-dependent hydrolase (beta-lactamase superfamily II)